MISEGRLYHFEIVYIEWVLVEWIVIMLENKEMAIFIFDMGIFKNIPSL